MKRKTLSLLIFLATLIAITIPLTMLASGGVGSDSFTSNVTVSNIAPVIGWVNDSVSQDPEQGGIKIIQIQFNVTDDNGVIDINTSDTVMNITRAGQTNRTATVCFSTDNISNTQWITCNISVYWYDEEGDWDITVNVTDSSGLNDANTTSTFTLGTMDAVDVIEDALTFTGNPGQIDRPGTPSPLTINNTGNQNYSNINLTGFELEGAVSSAILGVGNFTVNVTDGSGDGQVLVNDTPIQIVDAALIRNATSTQDLYFYVDIPSGIENDEYTTVAGEEWVIKPIVT